MTYDTVAGIDNNNLVFNDNNGYVYSSVKNLLDLLNDSSTNSWSYHVGQWEASVPERHIGEVVFMPMWAGAVKTVHQPKTYDYWEGNHLISTINVGLEQVIRTINQINLNPLDPWINKLIDFISKKIAYINKILKHFELNLDNIVDCLKKLNVFFNNTNKPFIDIKNEITKIFSSNQIILSIFQYIKIDSNKSFYFNEFLQFIANNITNIINSLLQKKEKIPTIDISKILKIVKELNLQDITIDLGNENGLNQNDKDKLKQLIKDDIKKIINDFFNKYQKKKDYKLKLKPILFEVDNQNGSNTINNLKCINFGVTKVIYYNSNSLLFKSNNFLPIIDYIHQTHCLGWRCSHNLRSLVDVIITSVRNLLADNFGNFNNLFSLIANTLFELLTSLIFKLINIFDVNKTIFPNTVLSKLFNSFFYKSFNNNAIHTILQYLNDNLPDILFTFLGKVEKHGIQFGKCGDLWSGVKISSNQNIVNYNNPTKIVLYSKNNIGNHLFNKSYDGYDLNTIQCIVELRNYKDLYNYINNDKINRLMLDNSIKNNLNQNIKNHSLSSKQIYEQLIVYLNKGIIPKVENKELNSFKKFKSNGWIIPKINQIQNWDLLCEYVLPNYFSHDLSVQDNYQNTLKFFSNFSFLKNKVNNIKNVVFDNEYLELIRNN